MQKAPSVRGYKDVTPLNLMSYVSCWIRVRTVVNSIASRIESSFPCGASDLNLLHQGRVCGNLVSPTERHTGETPERRRGICGLNRLRRGHVETVPLSQLWTNCLCRRSVNFYRRRPHLFGCVHGGDLKTLLEGCHDLRKCQNELTLSLIAPGFTWRATDCCDGRSLDYTLIYRNLAFHPRLIRTKLLRLKRHLKENGG